MDLTILLLTLNEEQNVGAIIAEVREQLQPLQVQSEILVVDGGSRDRTVELAAAKGARVHTQQGQGYAAGLLEGFERAKGEYIICLDVDGSHPPELIARLWEKRSAADCVIASRFIVGGRSDAPLLRRTLSWLLSIFYPLVLSLPVRDVSSGYRLYRRSVLKPKSYRSRDFSVLVEILLALVSEGSRVAEVPLAYRPRRGGSSKARIFRFGVSYLSVLLRMWSVRNSASCADYDDRAFDSRIPIQRYWQRRRFQIILQMLGEPPERIADVGCGSSRIIQSLPHALAADYSLPKLRFLSATNPLRCRLSIFALPFPDAVFDAVICSQVIEHVPFSEDIFRGLARVIKPGGTLIIGTPDYGRVWWPIIEFFYHCLLPNAYADEHITHYTRGMLKECLERHGMKLLEEQYICGGELIMRAQKSS